MRLERVLVLCADQGIPLYGPSGSSAHLRGVSRALARRGAAVHIAVPRTEDRRGAVRDPLPATLTTLEPRRWGWLPRRWRDRGELWDARRLLRRALAEGPRPELIYERHALFCDAGARAAQRHGLLRVVELNAPLSLERSRYGRVLDPELARAVEERSLRSADRVICVSSWLARWAVEVVGCEAERVRHVPNGVEARPRGDRARTRAKLGLQGLVIGFAGSMKPWHGVHRLGALLDALPEATLLIAGDGPVPPPQHPRCHALGRVPPEQLPAVVAAMDVALAPYAADAPPWFCPLKILEYRAQGVPVVAADIGDCRALVGSHGEIVEDQSPAAWAAAVRRQAGQPRQAMLRSWTEVVDEALQGLP